MKYVTTGYDHSLCANGHVVLTHCAKRCLQIIRTFFLLAMFLLNINNRYLGNSFFLGRFLFSLLFPSTHLHNSLQNIIHISEWSEILREISSEHIGIELLTKRLIETQESFIIEDLTETKWSEELTQKLIFIHHIATKGISEHLSGMVTGMSPTTSTCKTSKEGWTGEEIVKEIRSCCATEWIPSPWC